MMYKAFYADKGDMGSLVAGIKRNRVAYRLETGQDAMTLLVRPSLFQTMERIFSNKLNVRRHPMPDGVFGITA